MVVDLAVEHDPALRVGYGHRLQAPLGEIEDRQPTVAQPNGDRARGIPLYRVRNEGVTVPPSMHPTQEEALAVRSAVRLQVVHPLQDGHVNRAIDADDSYDAAHGNCSLRAPPSKESRGATMSRGRE